ncbi:hypothetical protein [Methanoculleus chikugoensis]|uniref:PEP/pyruvate-binding domain-containing protein n=1 Tax=Methanoculleus chikugoensis TaxID=118126 RepID=UPI001FB37136|nr:PEP/pyruvate-binding domain-containing protein [Methanoculleus chikugoensis]
MDDDDILTLAGYALTIEDHYSAKANKPVPMDIEWAKDGETGGELFVVQARPETVQSQKAGDVLETYRLDERGGWCSPPGRASGGIRLPPERPGSSPTSAASRSSSRGGRSWSPTPRRPTGSP